MLEVPELRAELVAANYLTDLARGLDLVPMDALARAVALLLDARAGGRRVYIVGNGGSAATASHMMCDLAKTARVPGLAPLRVFALADNTPLLTAWANDTTYEQTFAEQVAGLVEPGDVVVAISASGNSPNVVAAVAAASEKGARTIGLLGFDGGACLALVDVPIHVPFNNYGLVEDTHSAIAHAMTAAIRKALDSETS